jgi:hypothetical protein
MASKSKRRALTALLALFTVAATPDPSYIGIQGLALVGVHRDVAVNQHGIGAGPLLQLHLGFKRFALNLEGLPVLSIPGVRPSVAYGQATPKLGIFNGQAEFAVDRDASLWLGLGETVYNQRTPLPAQAQSVSSRLAGVRYVVRFRHDLRRNRFVEALVGGAPYLSGSDVYVYLSGAPNLIKPERASEVDASLEYGIRRPHSEWLFGVRTLNFSAQYLTGAPADRNVGAGPMIEWRDTF